MHVFTEPRTDGPRAALANGGLRLGLETGPDGRIRSKTEESALARRVHAYVFDRDGRLTDVRLNGLTAETYRYNAAGQRDFQRRLPEAFFSGAVRSASGLAPAALALPQADGPLAYDGRGRLMRAGALRFLYDRQGALARRVTPKGDTIFFYGDDTLLDGCRLPNGMEIRHEYGGGVNPLRRFSGDRLTAEYVWLNPLQLARCRDHEQELDFEFTYGRNGFVERVRIAPFSREKSVPFASLSLNDPRWLSAWAEERWQERLMGLFGPDGGPAAFLCGCDQVGTVKLLSRENGSPVKEMTYDSFGTLLSDSLPDLVFPLGFAGGLADRDTGLVRFGYRDYDPAVGRFTAPDPAGDMRGDGDMYDYCVDDPVNRVDPTGLWSTENSREDQATRGRAGQFASGEDAGNRSYNELDVQKTASLKARAEASARERNETAYDTLDAQRTATLEARAEKSGSVQPTLPVDQKVGKSEWLRAQDRSPQQAMPGSTADHSAVSAPSLDGVATKAVETLFKKTGVDPAFASLFVQRVSGKAALDNIYFVAAALDLYAGKTTGKSAGAVQSVSDAISKGLEATTQLPGRIYEELQKKINVSESASQENIDYTKDHKEENVKK